MKQFTSAILHTSVLLTASKQNNQLVNKLSDVQLVFFHTQLKFYYRHAVGKGLSFLIKIKHQTL